MTREEFIGKLRSIYVGEENAIDEIISEYDRLNNIINELEKWLKKEHENGYEVYYLMAIQDVLDKLKALKEGNKDE